MKGIILPCVQADRRGAETGSFVERLKTNGSESDWGEFYERYRGMVFSTAAKYGLSRSDCEDVLQEVAIELQQRILEFRYERERCLFRTWLMHLTRSKVVGKLRKLKPAEPLGEEAEAQWATSFEDSWEKDRRALIFKEAFDRIRAEAPPQNVQVFQLLVMQEKSAKEVARMLRMTRAGVYMRNHKIKQLLCAKVKKLEKEGF